ncbi:MAG: anhydro-N-acetylmuramic acid kinase [Rickettsiales bacterium]|nr:anhydro-N-acetylmuramic acid kinase [Rickettsiales bacterium]
MTKETGSVWAMGLMSGTSLDGIDVALIKTDGHVVHEFGAWLTVPYDEPFKVKLREAVHGRGDLLAVEQELTLKHAEAVKALLAKAGSQAKDVHVIGFHGQTVAHRPAENLTWQIGNGSLLAEKTRINVVCDFRRRDVAAGGQGAPLVPLYHAALARHMELPIVVLNIGGIANVTWIGRSELTGESLTSLDILAFDTGPGNALINDWVFKKTGADCDLDGKLALAGQIHPDLLAALLDDPFFAKHPPKSLDRNYFTFQQLQDLSVEDGAATLTEFTAAAIEKSSNYFPLPATQWFVSGGGRHNHAVMQALKKRFLQVFPVESLGWVGDALEAQAFAFLAMRSLQGLPLSLPTTTGAARATTGGAFHKA